VNEATCKAAVARLLRAEVLPRGGAVLRHEDQFTGGIPDLSASLAGRTVWAEFKLDRPGKRSILTGLQRDTLGRLRGLEVHYKRHGAALAVDVTDYWSGVLLAHAVGRPAGVHRVVAGAILKRLEI
jgi:hypothetical protein